MLFNIIQHIHRLLAWFLRKVDQVAWLYVLIWPIKRLNEEFYVYATAKQREASYNGQVMVLERALNLRFLGLSQWATASDPTANGGIYIENTGVTDLESFSFNAAETAGQEAFAWNDGETIPSGAEEAFAWNDSESNGISYSFIVHVPSSYTYDESTMRDFIDRYKLAGKHYIIQSY